MTDSSGPSLASGPGETTPTVAGPRWPIGPLLAATITVLFWSSAFVGIRYAGPYISPGPLTLMRLGVGTVVLGIFTLIRREALPKGRDWIPLTIIGVIWFGVYNVAVNAGERVLDAGTTSLIINISPILIALMAGRVLREGFPRTLLIGIGIAFAGSVIVGLSSEGDAGSSPVVGVLLCLLAAVVYAISVIIQKGVLQRVSGLQATFIPCAIGAICTLPFGPQLFNELSEAPASVAWTAAYLGMFPTAIAFTTWAYALRHLPAGRLGAQTYAVPALVVLLAWLLLDEVPPWGALLGGAMCLIGVAVSRMRTKTR